MATHITSILQELSIQPGDTHGLNKLINSFPYFETPYILKALNEKDDAGALHNAALVNNKPAWLQALLQPEPVPVTQPEQTVSAEQAPVPEEPVQQIPAEIPVTATTGNPEPVTSNLQPVTGNPEPVTSNQQPETSNQQPATSELTFEPFHTVDYFASQGIKPAKDALPTDRFSHQLRSFTDWLKTMKKLSVAEMETAPMKPAQQEEVVQLAETSLKKTEVITETMAEVLVKQGRINEAIEILQKLSLLDKGKSAYFAARIQHLKTI